MNRDADKNPRKTVVKVPSRLYYHGKQKELWGQPVYDKYKRLLKNVQQIG